MAIDLEQVTHHPGFYFFYAAEIVIAKNLDTSFDRRNEAIYQMNDYFRDGFQQ